MNTKIMNLLNGLPDNIDGVFVDAILITSPINNFYFSGFRSSSGAMLITKDVAYRLVDFRYYEAAKRSCIGCESILFESLTDKLKELFKKHNLKNVLLESDDLTISSAYKMRKSFNEIRVKTIEDDTLCNAIKKVRMIKTSDEIELIKISQSITDKAFSYILNFIKEGLTEKEIAIELEFFMRRNGAESAAFDVIVASGENSSLPHAVPSNREIKKGDIVTIDMGAVVGGYHSDMTRTIFIGWADQEKIDVYNIVLQAQVSAIKALKPNASSLSVDKAARDIIYKKGYRGCFGHSTGHGVGLEIHEDPRLSPKSDFVLNPGMVVTVEPGIYLNNKFGVRIEDMLLITDTGFENLTYSDKNVIVI